MSRVSALSVAVLLVLAGCGAVGPGDSQTTTLEPAEPPYEPPLEDSDLVADHVDALRDAGTFTFERNTTIEGDSDGDVGATRRVRVDLDDGAVAWTQRPSPVAQLYRFPNGTSYISLVTDDSRSYRRNPAQSRETVAWARDPVSDRVEEIGYEHAGATTRRGERVHVYRATDPSAANASALALTSEQSDVVSLNATLHVRESGLVTRLDVRYVVESGGVERWFSWRTRLSGFGDTDVSPPAWVDDAREATRNESG